MNRCVPVAISKEPERAEVGSLRGEPCFSGHPITTLSVTLDVALDRFSTAHVTADLQKAEEVLGTVGLGAGLSEHEQLTAGRERDTLRSSVSFADVGTSAKRRSRRKLVHLRVNLSTRGHCSRNSASMLGKAPCIRCSSD